MLDQVEIIGNDLADGLLETRQITMLPRAELPHLGLAQVLHLVFGRIVNIVSQGLEQRRDLRAPSFA